MNRWVRWCLFVKWARENFIPDPTEMPKTKKEWLYQ